MASPYFWWITAHSLSITVLKPQHLRIKVMKRITQLERASDAAFIQKKIEQLKKELWHLNGVLDHDLNYDAL